MLSVFLSEFRRQHPIAQEVVLQLAAADEAEEAEAALTAAAPAPVHHVPAPVHVPVPAAVVRDAVRRTFIKPT